ncbi:MAG: GNAT family N-acetyltransferase, partial [Clostridia bacterium]|nr:GNAT family N-acetyltransferase [Clostridia bacterium]
MSLETIKTVEDLSLNAWPSHQMQVYDGWILRFSYFYTHRTNCVETIGPAQLPIAEKVAYCEEVYEKWGTPCIFKISPLTTPALELFLEERGYEEQHRVDNMVLDLASCGNAPVKEPALPLVVGDRVDDEWLDALFELKAVSNADHLRVVPSMYAAIPKDEITVKVLDREGRVAGTGLGILDRGYVGVYA